MPLALDDLVRDGRLERLFSKHGRDCALQLWVLRVNSDSRIESRVLYGRLLPYNHSSNTWYAADDDHFEPVGEHRAQIIRVSLYIKSIETAALLKHLSDGHTIAQLSHDLSLTLSQKLAGRIGTTMLGLPVVYSPVIYLLNRDARDRQAPLSPHGGAGAFSASITTTDKSALFRTGTEFNEALANFIVERLDSDTGLQFGNSDLTRLGDLELLVFPTLDDHERELLSVDWRAKRTLLAVKLNPIRLPHFDRFHVRVAAFNDSQMIFSNIASVDRVAGSDIECEFQLPDKLSAVVDETEVEIHGSGRDDWVSTLCCRWRISYVREININIRLAGQSAGSVRFDWLKGDQICCHITAIAGGSGHQPGGHRFFISGGRSEGRSLGPS